MTDSMKIYHDSDYETSEITCLTKANCTASSSFHFYVSDGAGSSTHYYAWLNVGGADPDPAEEGTAIECDISAQVTADNVSDKIVYDLRNVADVTVSEGASGIVKITNDNAGYVNPTVNGDIITGFTITKLEVWSQITGIVQYPKITHRLDTYGTCTVTVSNFEGATFSDWTARDLQKMKITDGTNTLFQGYLKSRKFTQLNMVLSLVGFAAELEWDYHKADYIIEEGRVEDVPGDTATATNSFDISGDFLEPYDLCYNSLDDHIYIACDDDDAIYEYTSAMVYVATHDVSAKITSPRGICWDGNNFWVIGRELVSSDRSIAKYSDAMAWISTTSVETQLDGHTGIEWDGLYFYLTDNVNNSVFKYESDLTYDSEIDISGTTTDPDGITYDGTHFYITSNTDDNVYKFDSDWTLISTTDISGINGDIIGITIVKGFFFVTDAIDDYVYKLTSSFALYSLNYTLDLEVEDPNEPGAYIPANWSNQYWINEDYGILITDNASGFTPITWKVSAVSTSGTILNGNAASTQTDIDGDYYTSYTNNSQTITLTIDDTLDDSIPDTSTINSIKLTYHIDNEARLGTTFVHIQAYDGTNWINLKTFNEYALLTWIATRSGTVNFPVPPGSDLSDYLEDSDANNTWDKLKGFRITTYTGSGVYSGIFIDYINIDIKYSSSAISPVMEKISDNGASYIETATFDWAASGVQIEDYFKIARSTTYALDDCLSIIPYQIDSTLTKYMARNFRGTKRLDILRAIALLEGLFWKEDHANRRIVISKEADFADSAVDLDESDYDINWNYDDDVNHYKSVLVLGNASLLVEKQVDDTAVNTSKMTKVISDDTIMTESDAFDVATEQLNIWKTKRPSIFLTLDGTNPNLEVMKTVDITLSKPTVAKAAYVIRRLDRFRKGASIKTQIYAGLGSTPAEEKLANTIKHLQFAVQKTKQERRTNTPAGAGASITTGDIAGLEVYVQSLSINNVVEDTTPQLGGNLDLNGKNLDSVTPTELGYVSGVTSALQTQLDNISSSLMIGIANACYIPCLLDVITPMTAIQGTNTIRNTGGTDFYLNLRLPLPATRGGLNLYVTDLKIDVYDADANDYIDSVEIRAMNYNTYTQKLSDGTNRTAAGSYDYAVTNFDASSYTAISVNIKVIATTANDFDLISALLKCYYDT